MFQALDGSRPYVSDATECARATAPASTFKIPHALIALQTGVVKDVRQVFPYDGTSRSFETWKRDHTLESAIQWSVLPVFRTTATLIGRHRMQASLSSLNYAADTFEGDLVSFWTNGDLAISPAEQLSFLSRMFRYQLPIPRPHVDAIKAAMVMPEGSITNAAGTHPFPLPWPKGTVLRAKTGNTRVGDERISWLIGQLEFGGRQYVFVSRVRKNEALPTTAGADLARRMLSTSRPKRLRQQTTSS